MAVAKAAGRITFANNCQPCHGAGGGGQPGYPGAGRRRLDLGRHACRRIQQTITYGIRSGDPKARSSQMLRFGADGMLKPEQIQQVADYVMTMYGKGEDGQGRDRRQGDLRRQLRRLSRRRRPGQPRRSARPGWPRGSICMATRGRPWWRRSPTRAWA